MLSDYQIQPNSRRCFVSGRELKPGEAFYSVLLEQAGRFLRREYSREAWQGPPEGASASGWARYRPAQDRRPPVDDDMLLDCFARLEGQTEPARVNFRYVLALLLLRRKRLKFEGAGRGDVQILRLRSPQTRTVHEVVNPALTEEEMQTVQDEVFKVLGWQ